MLDSHIEDVFGKRYVLKLPFEISSGIAPGKSMQALRFTDESQAYQFLRRLRTSQNFWQRTLKKVTSLPTTSLTPASHHIEKQISQLLYRKKIALYELANFNRDSTDSSKRSVEKSNGDKYTFSHVSTLLVAAPLELLPINSKAEAEKLLKDIAPDKKQLAKIAKELNIQTPASADANQTTGLIVKSLVANDVVVSVQKKLSIPPKPDKEAEAVSTDKPVSLAPESGAAVVAAAVAIDAMSNVNQKSQAETLKKAAEDGKPFCEECEKAKAAKSK